MAITAVQKPNGATNSVGGASVPITLTATGAGEAIFVMIFNTAGTAPTIADSQLNTYVEDASKLNGSTWGVYVFSCLNPTSGVNLVTVTPGGASQFAIVFVGTYTGLLTSAAFDKTNGATASSGATYSSGLSGTLSQAAELCLGLVGTGSSSNGAFAATGSWTNPVALVGNSGNGDSARWQQQIVAATTSLAATGSKTSGLSNTSIIATYKGASSTNVTVSATGSSMTATAGTVTVTGTANVSAIGSSITSSVGSVTTSGTANVSAVGSSMTSAVGTVSISGSANVTSIGSVITSAVGSVSISGSANVAATGNALTITAGNVSISGSVTVTATGNALSISTGTVSVSGSANISASGNTLTITAGSVSLSGSANVSVSGNSLTITAGSVTVNTGGSAPSFVIWISDDVS